MIDITHTSSHTHLFNGLLFRTTRVSWYQKGKPVWILLKQETVSGSGISWAIYKSAPCCRQITTPTPHHSVYYRPDALPAAQPTALKAHILLIIYSDVLTMQIIIPKLKNEPMGVVIVESGWGSMVPTIVLASMAPSGAAARCSQLNVGDQIMSVNGVSLVGLPLSTCQNYVKVADFDTLCVLLSYSNLQGAAE